MTGRSCLRYTVGDRRPAAVSDQSSDLLDGHARVGEHGHKTVAQFPRSPVGGIEPGRRGDTAKPAAARGATPRWCCAPRRICSQATSTGAAVLFAESSALAVTMSNTDSFVLSESGLAVLAMDGGRWAAAAEHVQRALGAIDEHRMHDYATSLLAFAAAARLAVHRGDAMEVDLWVPETRALPLTWSFAAVAGTA